MKLMISETSLKKAHIEVKEFAGKLDPNAFLDRMISMGDYFKLYNMSDDRHVGFVKMNLTGHARIWWLGVEDNLAHLGQYPIVYWE